MKAPGVGFSVLIVDECPVIRYGLRQILVHQCHCDLIGECCGSEAREHMRRRGWSAVIIGIPIAEGGFQLFRDLVRAGTFTKIVLLSSLPGREYACKAIEAGASGYLTKQDSVHELVSGLRNILAGRIYVSSSMGREPHSTPNGDLPHEGLSAREYSVFLGIVGGKRLSRVAEELNVNSKTVSTYRRRVLEKMRLECNADLVAYALRHISRVDSDSAGAGMRSEGVS